MKTLKKILLVIVVLAVVLALIGFLLPSTYRVERVVVMRTTPETVFPFVNQLKKWPEWTAWTVERYPDMQVKFDGPEEGIGATYSWTGKSSGNGVLKITASEPNRSVSYLLDFENGQYVSQGVIRIEPGDAATTKVSWSNGGELGMNPVNRYFGLLMDRFMGPDFQSGLEKLRGKVETKP